MKENTISILRISARFQTAAGIAAIAAGFMMTTQLVKAQQVGDAFVIYNVSTGELRVNPGNAGISQGNGISSYGIRPDPAVITFSSTATDFSYLSGAYPLFPPALGNVTVGDDNTIGAAFYTLGAPNVNSTIGYFNHNNMVLGTAAQAGSGGGTTWGPGTGGVVASEIPGTYLGTPEWSFGTIGSTGMTTEQALTAFGATTQGGLSSSNQMVYGINGVTGTQNFRVYATQNSTGSISAIPEPSSGLVLGSLVLSGLMHRRRK